MKQDTNKVRIFHKPRALLCRRQTEAAVNSVKNAEN